MVIGLSSAGSAQCHPIALEACPTDNCIFAKDKRLVRMKMTFFYQPDKDHAAHKEFGLGEKLTQKQC